MKTWGKSRRLVNVPFDEHGRRHPVLWLEVLTAATLRCSPRCFWETWWERHMSWTEWSVPRVWRTRRICQLFENSLWARRDDKIITQTQNFPGRWKFCISSILRKTGQTDNNRKHNKTTECLQRYEFFFRLQSALNISLRAASTISFVHAWSPRAFRARTCCSPMHQYQTRVSSFYGIITNYTVYLKETFGLCYEQ